MKFSFNRTIRSLGIDFGATSIRAIELEFSRDGRWVTSMGKVETPKVEGGLMKDAMVKALQTLISQANIKSRKVICSLPSTMVNVKHVRLPNLSKNELRDILSIEAERYIGNNIEDFVIDFSIVGEVLEKGQKKKEVILVWFEKEDMNQYLAWLKEAGFVPYAMEVSIWSGLRAIDRIRDSEKAVMVLDLGSETVTLGALHGDEISFARKIPWGSDEFTRLIQKRLKLDLKSAEMLKREYGVGWAVHPHTQNVETNAGLSLNDARSPQEVTFEILRQQLNVLEQEIQSSLGYFSALTQGQPVGELILIGGGSLLKGIAPYLTSLLHIPVRCGNPFDSFTANSKSEQSDGKVGTKQEIDLNLRLETGSIQANGESVEWAVALGAALRSNNARY